MLKRGELIVRTWYKSIEKCQRNERERWLYLELGDHRKLLLPLRLEEVLFSGARPCGLLWLLLSVIMLHVGRPGLARHSCCGTAIDAQSPLWALLQPVAARHPLSLLQTPPEPEVRGLPQCCAKEARTGWKGRNGLEFHQEVPDTSGQVLSEHHLRQTNLPPLSSPPLPSSLPALSSFSKSPLGSSVDKHHLDTAWLFNLI